MRRSQHCAAVALLGGLQISRSSDRSADRVRQFYDAVNARDVDAAVSLFAEDVVYEDMIYAQPFVVRRRRRTTGG